MATRCTQEYSSLTPLILFTGSMVDENALPEGEENLKA